MRQVGLDGQLGHVLQPFRRDFQQPQQPRHVRLILRTRYRLVGTSAHHSRLVPVAARAVHVDAPQRRLQPRIVLFLSPLQTVRAIRDVVERVGERLAVHTMIGRLPRPRALRLGHLAQQREVEHRPVLAELKRIRVDPILVGPAVLGLLIHHHAPIFRPRAQHPPHVLPVRRAGTVAPVAERPTLLVQPVGDLLIARILVSI